MKVHVIVDGQGKIMGALAKGRRAQDAEEVVIRPAHPDHRLHEVEVSDDAFRLSPEEFEKHVKGHVEKKPSA
jgi:hypothetical protein